MNEEVVKWIRESRKRGEEIEVVIRNKTTGKEAKSEMSPEYAVGIANAEFTRD